MEIYLWVLIILVLILFIYKCLKYKKIPTNHTTIIIIFFVFPLSLYLLKWSKILENYLNINFVYVIFIFLIALVIDIVTYIPLKYKFKYEIKYNRTLLFFAIVYIFLYLTENILLSGDLFPILRGKGYQHQNISGLNFLVTRNLLPILILLSMKYNLKKSRINLFLGVCILLLPVITRGARIYVFQDILTIFMIWILLDVNNLLDLLKNKKKIIIIGLSSIIFMTAITNYRLKKFGYQGDIKKVYTNAIEYNGLGGEIGAILYAYFPMSYDNLNRSLSDEMSLKINKKRNVLNYFGINTLKGIYFGLFKINKLFNISPYEYLTPSTYLIGAANVPTMFYEIYVDFGIYIFIPIIILFCILKILEFNSNKSLKKLMVYCIFCSGLFLISFQNLIFDYYLVWKIFITFLYMKIFIKEEKNAGINNNS